MSGLGIYIALSATASLSGPSVVSAYRDLYPHEHAKIVEVTQKLTDVSLFEVYGQRVLMVILPTSLPSYVYIPALETAGWEEARGTMRRHKAHAVITWSQGKPNDHAAAVAAAKAVASVAGAAISKLPASAVMLEGSQLIVPPEIFSEITAEAMDENEPATPLWVSYGSYATNPPTLVSRGLREFVGREIEFSTSELPVEEIADRVLGMGQYLVTKGPVIKDGETFGVLPQERLRVRYAPEGLIPGIPVYKLTVEVLAPLDAPAP